MSNSKLAIVNNVPVSRPGIVAICEYYTFDVLGNAKEGYEVNDRYGPSQIEIGASVDIHNMPRVPGASDGIRSFPESFGITTEVLITFSISDRSIKRELGIKGKIEIDGDDHAYFVTREKDGYPLCEIHILRFEDHSDN